MRLFFDLGELSLGSLGKGKTGKKGKLAGKNFLALFDQTQQKGQSAGSKLGKAGKSMGLGLMSEKALNLPGEQAGKGKRLKLLFQGGEVTLPKMKAGQAIAGEAQPKLVKGERGWLIQGDKAGDKKSKLADVGEAGAAELLEKGKAGKLKDKGEGTKGKVDSALQQEALLENPVITKEQAVFKKSKAGKASGEDAAVAGSEKSGKAKGKGKAAVVGGRIGAEGEGAADGVAIGESSAKKSVTSAEASAKTSANVAAGKAGVVSTAVAGEVKQTAKHVISEELTKPGKIPKQSVDEKGVLTGKERSEKSLVPESEKGVPGPEKGVSGSEKQGAGKQKPVYIGNQQQVVVDVPLKGGNDTVVKGKNSSKQNGNGAATPDKGAESGPSFKPEPQGVLFQKLTAHREVPLPNPPVVRLKRGATPGPNESQSKQVSEMMQQILDKAGGKGRKTSASPLLTRDTVGKQSNSEGLPTENKTQAKFQPVQKMPSSKMASWIAAHREALQTNKVEVTSVQHEVVFAKSRPDLKNLVGRPIEKSSLKMAQGQQTTAMSGKQEKVQQGTEITGKLVEMQSKEPNKTVLVNSLTSDAKGKSSKKAFAAANQASAKMQSAKQSTAAPPTTPQAVTAQAEVHAPPAFAAQKPTVSVQSGEQAAMPEHITKLGVEDRSLTSAMDKAQAKANLGSLRAAVNETSVSTAPQQGLHQSAMSADIPHDADGLPQPMFRDLEAQLAKAVRIRPNAVTLKLNPQELGEVRIRVIRRGEQLQAKIMAENPQTADLITENQSKLEERLREQGIEIDQFDVLSDGGSTGGFDQGQSGWERQAEYAMRADLVAGDPWGRVSESESERLATEEEPELNVAEDVVQVEADLFEEADAELVEEETEIETTV